LLNVEPGNRRQRLVLCPLSYEPTKARQGFESATTRLRVEVALVFTTGIQTNFEFQIQQSGNKRPESRLGMHFLKEPCDSELRSRPLRSTEPRRVPPCYVDSWGEVTRLYTTDCKEIHDQGTNACGCGFEPRGLTFTSTRSIILRHWSNDHWGTSGARVCFVLQTRSNRGLHHPAKRRVIFAIFL